MVADRFGSKTDWYFENIPLGTAADLERRSPSIISGRFPAPGMQLDRRVAQGGAAPKFGFGMCFASV